MAIKRPDIYEHNNPVLAIADSNFVRGGGRVVADPTALYALSANVDQLKEKITRVWVTSLGKYYILTDITNVGNTNGWTQETVGTGTVTSISVGSNTISGLSLSTGGSAITTTGTISLAGTLTVSASDFGTQAANTVLAGPTSGANATPTFRGLVSADIPNNAANTTGSAAKWTTARLLAGNSVDGSSDVAFTNKFIVQGTADSGLSGAQFLGALSTGILKVTTTTGVLSTAISTDFPTLNQNTTGTAAGITGGAANQLLYQTGANTTNFVTAPTTSSTYLSWNGAGFAWTTPTGAGDVTGPSLSVDSEIVLFSGTTGKQIKRATNTGMLKASSGVIATATAGTDYALPTQQFYIGTTQVAINRASGSLSLTGVSIDGTAGSVTNTVTFNNSGTGDASGTTYNGSTARTVSYNTIGASPLAGSTSLNTLGTVTTGTWNGTLISPSYGGTGLNTLGTAGQLLRVNTGASALEYFTPAYVSLSALSATAPLSYNNTTGVFSIPAATNSQSGYLSNGDWGTFNSKEPAIVTGTTAQYWRGDKTWQTLNTDTVPETATPSNKYYTNARTIASTLTNYVSGSGTISASDTILQAIQKLNGNIAAINPGISGSGTAGQITYWSSGSAVTGSATFTFSPTAALLVNNSVTAASLIARGINFTPTLIASANNDVLVGLDVTPSFTNGAFTGISNYALRVNGGSLFAAGTVSASNPIHSLTQTWNSGATTFNSLLLNITDTGSNTASTFAKYQIGGSDRFSFRKDGVATFGLAGASAGKLILSGATSGTVTLQTALNAGSWSLTLPTSAGNNGEYLKTDGNGVTSWSPLSVSNATNISSGSPGDLLYQSNTSTTSFINAVDLGQVLISQGLSHKPDYSANPVLGLQGNGAGSLTLQPNGSANHVVLKPSETTTNNWNFVFPEDRAAINGQLLAYNTSNDTTYWVSGLTNPMNAQGSIIYGGSGGTPQQLVAPITNGYVLAYNTTSNTPEWVSGGSGSPAKFDSGNEIPVRSASGNGTSQTYGISNYPKFKLGDTVTTTGITPSGYSLTGAVTAINYTQAISRNSNITAVSATSTTITYTLASNPPFLSTDNIAISGLVNSAFNLTGQYVSSTINSITYANPGNLVATLTAGVATVTLTTGNTRGLFVGQTLIVVSNGAATFATAATIATITGLTTFTMSANHVAVSGGTGATRFSPSALSANTVIVPLTCSVAITGVVTITGTTANETTACLYIGQKIYQSAGTATGLPSTSASTVTVTSITTNKIFTVSQTTGLTARTGVTITEVDAVYGTQGTAVYSLASSYTFNINGTTTGTATLTNASAYVGTKYNITAASGTGLYVTYTTGTTPHGYSVGDSVIITGVTPLGYNGAGIITSVPSTTQFVLNNPTIGSFTSGGTVLRQGYSTGTIPGNNLYDLQGRKTLRSFKPKSGAWITPGSINVTDPSTINAGGYAYNASASLTLTGGNNFRWLTLFTVPYDVEITTMAVSLSAAGSAGSKIIIGIYKMVGPEYVTGYLISPNSAIMAADTGVPVLGTATLIKSVALTTPIALSAGDLYGFFIASNVVSTSALAFGGLDTNESWAGFTAPLTGSSAATGVNLFAANFGNSFFEQGAPSVIPALTTLPSNLDAYISTLTANSFPGNPIIYLKTL
jgi:hypothetical protein